MDKVVERVNPLDIFPEHIRDNVKGLIYLGYLDREVNFFGHRFVVKTLRAGEKAAVAIATAPWRGTLGESPAWANGHVGMALTAIDGKDDFCPRAGPNYNDFARARLNYVTDPENGWYQATLDALFDVYLELEKEVVEAMEAYQNLDSARLDSSLLSPESSTEVDSSNAQMSLDTQPTENSN